MQTKKATMKSLAFVGEAMKRITSDGPTDASAETRARAYA